MAPRWAAGWKWPSPRITAWCCRARRLGLPEVNLGLLPGAGGTQRAPRLMGVKPAAEMMLSGKPLSARAALAAGLVDRLVDGSDAVAAGLACVQELQSAQAPLRRTRDVAIADKAAAMAELDALAADTAKNRAACSRR